MNREVRGGYHHFRPEILNVPFFNVPELMTAIAVSAGEILVASLSRGEHNPEVEEKPAPVRARSRPTVPRSHPMSLSIQVLGHAGRDNALLVTVDSGQALSK